VQRGLGEYDLCPIHAERLSAPKTWRFKKLVDKFPAPELVQKDEQVSRSAAQNVRTNELTTAAAQNSTKLREVKRQTTKKFPDDDLTALMRSVRENYSLPAIPVQYQGTKRRNLVAVRTGETSQTIPEVPHDD
jgi:hypothetical protein